MVLAIKVLGKVRQDTSPEFGKPTQVSLSAILLTAVGAGVQTRSATRHIKHNAMEEIHTRYD
jgi:hypothetical protein